MALPGTADLDGLLVKPGDRVRYTQSAHKEHTGTKGLYRGEGTIVQPSYRVGTRAIPTRIVDWDNGKTGIVSEGDLEVVQPCVEGS